MAGLGCGSYKFSNKNKNKSYIYVKLTDSAHKSLDEYLKFKNTIKTRPTVAFRGNEGEIHIPALDTHPTNNTRGHIHNGHASHNTATFHFNVQKAQESEGPQGSFDSLQQVGDDVLESLGPLLSILRIRANDDSYQNTRQSMANAVMQSNKNCVKELKSNNTGSAGMGRRQRTRPSMITPVQKKELNFTGPPSNTSPPLGAVSQSSNPQKQNPQVNGKNPALKSRPLRERIVHLLALKPTTKFTVMQRLASDGIEDRDRKKIAAILTVVGQLENNVYHLKKITWNEVDANWQFYSEGDKSSVSRNKASVTNSPSSTPGSPSHSDLSITLVRKRVVENGHPVGRNHSGFGSENIDMEDGPETRSSKKTKWQNGTMEEFSSNHVGKVVNGDSPPSLASVSPLSQNNSPRGGGGVVKENSTQYVNGHRTRTSHHKGAHPTNNNLSSNNERRSMRPIQTLTNGHAPPPRLHENSLTPDSFSSELTPDSTPNYHNQYSPSSPSKRDYPPINNLQQRRQYKVDFARIYSSYQILHEELAETRTNFKKMESEMLDHDNGTPEFNRIKDNMVDKYNNIEDGFIEKKKVYNHLDEVLRHIKEQVSKFDRV